MNAISFVFILSIDMVPLCSIPSQANDFRMFPTLSPLFDFEQKSYCNSKQKDEKIGPFVYGRVLDIMPTRLIFLCI